MEPQQEPRSVRSAGPAARALKPRPSARCSRPAAPGSRAEPRPCRLARGPRPGPALPPRGEFRCWRRPSSAAVGRSPGGGSPGKEGPLGSARTDAFRRGFPRRQGRVGLGGRRVARVWGARVGGGDRARGARGSGGFTCRLRHPEAARWVARGRRRSLGRKETAPAAELQWPAGSG